MGIESRYMINSAINLVIRMGLFIFSLEIMHQLLKTIVGFLKDKSIRIFPAASWDIGEYNIRKIEYRKELGYVDEETLREVISSELYSHDYPEDTKCKIDLDSYKIYIGRF